MMCRSEHLASVVDGDSQLEALRAQLAEAERRADEAERAMAEYQETSWKTLRAERDVVRDALRDIAKIDGGDLAWGAKGIAERALAVSVDEPPSPELDGTAEAVPGSGGAT